jgi:hypothetical protein
MRRKQMATVGAIDGPSLAGAWITGAAQGAELGEWRASCLQRETERQPESRQKPALSWFCLAFRCEGVSSIHLLHHPVHDLSHSRGTPRSLQDAHAFFRTTGFR